MNHVTRSLDFGRVMLLALTIVAGTALWGALPGPKLVLLSAFGATIGFAVFIIGERFRLLIAEQILVGICLLFVFGGLAAKNVPTPSAYAAFVRGLVGGWADLLTSVPPTTFTAEFRVLPYVLGWMAATLAFAIVRRPRYEALAVVPPITVFGFGLLFTADAGLVALIQGALLLTFGLAFVAYSERAVRADLDRSIGSTTAAARRGRILGGAGLAAVAVAMAPLTTAAFPGLDDRERFELRRYLEPPWDPLDEPSPLAQIKANYSEENEDEVVFTVTGDNIPKRWTVATLGHFDGTVWTVGTAELNGAAQFVSIDGTLPERPGESRGGDQRELVTLEVQITSRVDATLDGGELRPDSPWLPVVARTERIELPAEDRPDLRADTRSRTVAAPGGIDQLTYRVHFQPAAEPDQEQLHAATLVRTNAPKLELQAGKVRDQAAAMLQGQNQGWDQVRRIAQALEQEGFYEDVTTGRPGHSWARLDNFTGDDVLIGNEEQYAALAGVVARNANLPARVVVGYEIDDEKLTQSTIEVTRLEASAWVEFLTEEFGWIPVDVTPPRERIDKKEPETITETLVAAPNPPAPPPEQELAEPAQEDEEDEDDEEVNDENPLLRAAAITAGALSLPLIAFFGWIGAVAFFKTRRQAKRRRAATAGAQVVGAWQETNDRIVESGITLPRNLTARERATYLETAAPDLRSLVPLAAAVEETVYSGTEAEQNTADLAWQFCDEVIVELRKDQSAVERLRRAADPSTLLEKVR